MLIEDEREEMSKMHQWSEKTSRVETASGAGIRDV